MKFSQQYEEFIFKRLLLYGNLQILEICQRNLIQKFIQSLFLNSQIIEIKIQNYYRVQMNSPTNFRTQGFPINPQANRFVVRPPTPQIFIQKSPVMNHSIISHHSSYGSIPKAHTIVNQPAQYKMKLPEMIKTNSQNTPSRGSQYKSYIFEPRTSDISKCSIRQTIEVSSNQDINVRLNIMSDKISLIFQKIAKYDENFKEIREVLQENGKNKKQELNSTKNLEQKIKKAVQSEMQLKQQHFLLQNKVLKSDIDTIKDQIMNFVNKKQFKQKIQTNQKDINAVIKQFEQKNKLDIETILQKRKKDIERFQKQAQEIKAKLMQIEFAEDAKSMGKVCLVKNLNLKVFHKMHVYNQQQLKWIELGSGLALYGIDKEGYLLDDENKYITNEKGQLIKLDQLHVRILKKYGLSQ